LCLDLTHHPDYFGIKGKLLIEQPDLTVPIAKLKVTHKTSS